MQLQYFLGGSQNAVRIQIRGAFIADLLVQVLRSRSKEMGILQYCKFNQIAFI